MRVSTPLDNILFGINSHHFKKEEVTSVSLLGTTLLLIPSDDSTSHCKVRHVWISSGFLRVDIKHGWKWATNKAAGAGTLQEYWNSTIKYNVCGLSTANSSKCYSEHKWAWYFTKPDPSMSAAQAERSPRLFLNNVIQLESQAQLLKKSACDPVAYQTSTHLQFV